MAQFPPTSEIEARRILSQFTGGYRRTGTILFGFMLEIEYHPGEGTWTVTHEFPEDGAHHVSGIEAVGYLSDLVAISDRGFPETAEELLDRLENWS